MRRWLSLSILLMGVLLSGCAAPQETPTPPPSEEPPVQEVLDPDAAKMNVHFFHVDVNDWGDCTYIELPNGENMLIDTGLPAAAAQIANELLDAGVDTIDHLVLSHSHADHVKGLSNFLANMKVGHVYSTGYWTTDFSWVERDLNSLDIPHTQLTAGDRLTIGDVQVDILYPTAADVAEQPGVEASGTDGPGGSVNINGHSMVLKMTYGANSLLFTGDIYKEHQNEILAMYAEDPTMLKADILKIPHHGYDNAGSQEFIQAVSPAYAVSMGTHTMNERVYSYYTDAGCTAYLSWMNGDVQVTMDGSSYVVTPENPEILDYYTVGMSEAPSGAEG